MVLNCTTHQIYDTIRISKISNEQCNICRSWSKPVSKAMARVYCRIVYGIKFDAPIKGHHVYKETWATQKYDILYCKKEVLDIDKHVLGIYKEDRLVGHGFMTGDPMNCVSQGNLWARWNIFTEVNVMKVRNLFLWRAMERWTISCVVMVFRYIKTTTAQQDPERLIDKLILYDLHARSFSIKYKYPPSSIIAMGETSVSNGMVSNTTIHK